MSSDSDVCCIVLVGLGVLAHARLVVGDLSMVDVKVYCSTLLICTTIVFFVSLVIICTDSICSCRSDINFAYFERHLVHHHRLLLLPTINPSGSPSTIGDADFSTFLAAIRVR